MIRLQLLGSIDLAADDGARLDALLAQPKRLGLLAYLALARPRGRHRRDGLLPMFWPELDTRRARAALRQALFFLRRHLASGVIRARGEEIEVDRNLLRTDVEWIEDVLGAALRAEPAITDEVSATADRALERLASAPLMDGFHGVDAVGFERWLDGERNRLSDLGRIAAERLACAAETAGDAETAQRRARIALRMDPLDERAAARVIELSLRTGDRAGAVALWKRLDRLCRDEIGEPTTLDLERLLKLVPAVDPLEDHAAGAPRAAGTPEDAAPPDARSAARSAPSAPAAAAQVSVPPRRSTPGMPNHRGSPGRRHRSAVLAGGLGLATLLTLAGVSRCSNRQGLEPIEPVADGVRHVLWVDDNADNNVVEIARLRETGVSVTSTRSTAAALNRFDPAVFHLVISDMARYEGGEYRPRAGFEILASIRERSDTTRLIFYTSSRVVAELGDEILAAGAAGITASRAELFRLIEQVR